MYSVKYQLLCYLYLFIAIRYVKCTLRNSCNGTNRDDCRNAIVDTHTHTQMQAKATRQHTLTHRQAHINASYVLYPFYHICANIQYINSSGFRSYILIHIYDGTLKKNIFTDELDVYLFMYICNCKWVHLFVFGRVSVCI